MAASASSSPASTPEGVVTYQIDPTHSVVEFGVKHMMFSTVKGRFAAVAGEIQLDEANPTRSAVTAEIETASVDTRDANRDGHLRSPDFFDADNSPKITFASRSVEPTPQEGQYRIVGDLTIRNVTREVQLDAAFLGKGTDPWGGTRIGLTATTAINRKDYGLNWNAALESGGVLVSDQVKINLEIQAVKKS